MIVLYDTEDDNLLNYITDIKAHLKKAVDNENELFEITATIIKKVLWLKAEYYKLLKNIKLKIINNYSLKTAINLLPQLKNFFYNV